MNERSASEMAPREAGRWNCHKLECLADYLYAYSESMKKSACCYLELFARHERYSCKGTDCIVDGAPLRALKADRAFLKYIFVARGESEEEELSRLLTPFVSHNIQIINVSAIGEKTIRQLFDLVPRSVSCFAYIDPPGYRRVRWTTIKNLAAHGSDWRGNKLELLIMFPLEMALLRNLARPECEASITRLYGNREWQEIKQAKLDSKLALGEVRNKLVELFKNGLRSLGYRYVEDMEPARLSSPPVYHVISACDSTSRMTMLKNAWGKPRYLPCELLYNMGKSHENR